MPSLSPSLSLGNRNTLVLQSVVLPLCAPICGFCLHPEVDSAQAHAGHLVTVPYIACSCCSCCSCCCAVPQTSKGPCSSTSRAGHKLRSTGRLPQQAGSQTNETNIMLLEPCVYQFGRPSTLFGCHSKQLDKYFHSY